MALPDPLVMPLAQELLSCLRQEILKVADPPTYIGLRPGTVVDHLMSATADECCEGLAWIRPEGFYPSSAAFPGQDGSPNPTGVAAWAVTLEMGAVRCAPTPPLASIPTAGEWEAVTQAVMDDAAAMRRAVCCFISQGVGRERRVLVGEWRPLAVQGGCVGGTLSVVIRGPACDCSQAGPES